MTYEPLRQKYRPQRLDDVVGQPLGPLRALVKNPHPCCVLLEGNTGIGKSATAFALANDLGAYEDQWYETAYHVAGPEFGVDTVRRFFGPETPFRFIAPGGWHVLVIEELEYLSPQCQVLCKDAFERQLERYRLIVVATSNDTSHLKRPFLDRFKGRHLFFADGPCFAADCQDRLAEIWEAENPVAAMPPGWLNWGYVEGEPGFSMRRALDEMEGYLSPKHEEVLV